MKKTLLFFFLLFSAGHGLCQLTFSTRVIKDSLFIPWELIYGPDDHIWFTQKNGYICRMDTAGLHTDTLYHEAATVVKKESGMLGMALHPDFFHSPYVYVVWEYQNPALDIRERVCRYTYSPLTNTLSFPIVLIDSIHGYLYHNGCRLLIVDDKLFISVADATVTTNPQDLSSINGKILRVNLDGSIPVDNPFPNSPIWTWGHRNPQGLVYAHGILYSSEHGPDDNDEVNIIEKGRNYGWPNVHGYCDKPTETDFCRDSNVVEPLTAWTPTIAPCGIDYYDHNMFPTLRNSLIMASLKDAHLYQLQLSDDYRSIISATVINGFSYGRLRDVCVAPNGKIFVSTSNSDPSDNGKHIDRIIAMYDPSWYARQGEFVIYPNPAIYELNFVIPETITAADCKVYDMQGRLVASQSLNSARPGLTVAYLAQGIYIANIKTDRGSIYRGRFIKMQ